MNLVLVHCTISVRVYCIFRSNYRKMSETNKRLPEAPKLPQKARATDALSSTISSVMIIDLFINDESKM